MAPRTGLKRTNSKSEEKGVKKAPSTISSVTSKNTTTTRKASQPLAPSTSQNSVVKPAAVQKHKPRNPSTTQLKTESVPVAKSRKKVASPLRKPVTSNEPPTLNVYVFGSGSMGELGLGPHENQRNVKRPRLNPHLLPNEVGIVDVAVGGMHCAAIDKDGRVWTWGVNDQGVLGRDTTWTPENEDTTMDSDDEDEEQLNPRESVPGLVEGFPDGTRVEKIACGDSITVACTTDGKVYAWGTFRVCSCYSLVTVSVQKDC
jgi:regulator of chromosome condensation